MLQYIKKLQTTLKQYKIRQEAIFMVLIIREEASFETLRTRIEAIQTHSKGKAKLEDEETLDKALKDIDWKLVYAV